MASAADEGRGGKILIIHGKLLTIDFNFGSLKKMGNLFFQSVTMVKLLLLFAGALIIFNNTGGARYSKIIA